MIRHNHYHQFRNLYFSLKIKNNFSGSSYSYLSNKISSIGANIIPQNNLYDCSCVKKSLY